MKEFAWAWVFWITTAFCSLLVVSLLIAFKLFQTAPQNANTPVFAIGFGFVFGFVGLGASTLFFYDRLVRRLDVTKEEDGELVRKVIRETPFFFFSLIYFFVLAVYMGVFMLMIPFIRAACGSY
ncbi:MAG: hypothetical protein WA705_19085 [Candidatus Ozemobacteraceae bacterium]